MLNTLVHDDVYQLHIISIEQVGGDYIAEDTLGFDIAAAQRLLFQKCGSLSEAISDTVNNDKT